MTLGDTTGQAVDSEDVLDGYVPPTPARGPRHGFNNGRDYAVLALVTLLVIAVTFISFRESEFQATRLTPYTGPAEVLRQPELFPPSLGEAWRTRSPQTWQPVVINPQPDQNDGLASTVVTGDVDTVTGRDPQTGDVRWTYHRDLPLCTISTAFKKVVVAYRTDGRMLPDSDPRSVGGCSEITSLKPTTGERDRQRNLDGDTDLRLLDDGQDYLTALGNNLMTSLRFDLVKTVEYGNVATKVNPGKQPRYDCTYSSALTTPGKVGVIEHCPNETTDRLTVYRASAKDADTPEIVLSQLLDGSSAQVVAMNATLTAVVLPNPDRVVIFDEQGTSTGSFPVELGSEDLTRQSTGRTPLVTTGTGAFYWYTGTNTVVLSATDLRPLWTVKDTLGPGTIFAGRALVPVPDGIAVLSQADGSRVGTFPANRGAYRGPVTMNSIGPMVFEQRGEELVALH
ncbi:hypothetical protein [Actinokineospora sp. NBRC 105648]|uniref:Rv3212 family protein n=1 Tax=Actinokineospora sp. NBRC 105648 TaxID=3032206 RepID=UPI00255242D6|nr:hypothetical protein [Actinokineospora sp. NBRC 105648]